MTAGEVYLFAMKLSCGSPAWLPLLLQQVVVFVPGMFL